jgi:demethylmenaquinone methyltransferase/2-methoxy-6-polyprenyl-1,4-benzoquinol methylase
VRFLSVYKTAETNTPPTAEEMASMQALIEDGMKGGWLIATEGCLPSARGARVGRSGGKTTVTDGPFTESKELIAGFAILEAASKQEAIELAHRFLDVAGGTGDIAFRIVRRQGERPDVSVCDINAAMLAVGRDRAVDRGLLKGLTWTTGDAENLPFPDRSFDGYTIAFGLRNVTDIDKALGEAQRVLKPGGRFYCLEFSKVTSAPIGRVYDAYSSRALPFFGRIVAKDAESYRYLHESIRRFPPQRELARRLRAAGFANVAWRDMTLGVVALHSGWRV